MSEAPYMVNLKSVK